MYVLKVGSPQYYWVRTFGPFESAQAAFNWSKGKGYENTHFQTMITELESPDE